MTETREKDTAPLGDSQAQNLGQLKNKLQKWITIHLIRQVSQVHTNIQHQVRILISDKGEEEL